MNDKDPVVSLALHFLAMSPFAVGGVNSVVPEMHRQVVEVAGWMTDAQFAQMFAIAQAAPGPNMLIVTLIGWHVAGTLGAIVATLGLIGPTCLLAYVVGGVWHRFREARWRRIVQGGLVPLTIGLVSATGVVLAEGAARTPMTAVFTVLAALAIFLAPRISPLWVLAAGAALGFAGII